MGLPKGFFVTALYSSFILSQVIYLTKLMKIIKRILLALLLLSFSAVAIFYLYIQSLPTAPPDFVNFQELNNKAATPFNCANKTDFSYAYQVQVNIESVLNNKIIYHSDLKFNTQLTQANDAIIKGLASDIIINEGQGARNIKDVYYLSRVEPQPYALFTAFNDLGLTEKHPMKILAQLVKALSVGANDKKYHFSYDSMQRTYSYYHVNNIVSRNANATTASINQLSSSLQTFTGNNNWEVTLDKDCMPSSLHSQERKIISVAGHSGFINFTIDARRITPYSDLNSAVINRFSNSNNLWQTKAVASSEFEHAVKTEAELWSIINNFSNDKNTAKLIKAAGYLIENITADDLADKLVNNDFSDSAKRDLAFALSLSGHSDAENFLVDTLSSLSDSNSAGDMNSDLQKVRLMVALSGNGQVSEYGFQALDSLAKNPNESSNVRNNALINLGSTLQQMQNQGQDPAGLADQLTSTLNQAIKGENSASAILAAGNAKLDNLDQQIMLKLSSSNSKERYAAATVLARNPDYNDDLIQHLSIESSDLVNYAILSNLDVTNLSRQQKDRLLDISSDTSIDITKVIHQLIE